MGTYADHYTFIRDLESGYDPDPRAIARAQLRAMMWSCPIIFIGFWFGSVVATRSAGISIMHANPIALLIWTLSLPMTLLFGKEPDVGMLDLWRGWIFAILGIASSIIVWHIVYRKWKNDRTGLPGVNSRAHWMTPEEMAASGLLPPNYDVKRGFIKTPDFDPSMHLAYSRERAAQLRAARERAANGPEP